MAIKRFFATKDNTITNAFKESLTTRGTGSNMGASDILEVFSIYGQASSASNELSRVLIEFDTAAIAASRTAGTIPASGSVDFFLRMYDAEHVESTPKDYTLTIAAISQSWNEGTGLDMNNYTDLGESNWIKANSTTSWTAQGGDFLTGSTDIEFFTSKAFEAGTEDLSVNVTTIVENWLDGAKPNYGFGVFLTSSLEQSTKSYYTKKFFARNSEYFHRRPVLEARFNDFKGDDSSNFYLSSSRAPEDDNLNTLYMYNYIRGQLVDIPSGDPILRLFSGSEGPTGSALQFPESVGVPTEGLNRVGSGKHSTGIYSASFAFNSSSITTVYPVWYDSSDSEELFTGSAITVKPLETAAVYPIKDWVINITNLKTTYSTNEVATFRLYVRPKNWNPNLYTVAQTEIESTPIEKAYYKLDRVVDNFEVISYGTGSGNESYTQLSYDGSGNYFDLDMSMLQSGYSYQLTFLFNLVGEYSEQRAKFKFRVSDGD
tara:strand:- start:19549 stop:21012 length:1464 start_codon:yes stop_codon:yes gene_type:complete